MNAAGRQIKRTFSLMAPCSGWKIKFVAPPFSCFPFQTKRISGCRSCLKVPELLNCEISHRYEHKSEKKNNTVVEKSSLSSLRCYFFFFFFCFVSSLCAVKSSAAKSRMMNEGVKGANHSLVCAAATINILQD